MMGDFVDAVLKLESGRLGIADFRTWAMSLAWESTMASSPSAASLLWGIRSILQQWEDAEGALSSEVVAAALIQVFCECGFGDWIHRSAVAVS